MSYIYAEYLYLLPSLVAILLLTSFFGKWRRKRILKGLVTEDKKELLLSSASRSKRLLRTVLFIMAMTLIGYSATRPYKGEDVLQRPQQHRDLLVLFDVSKSMNVRDVRSSTRLDYSKWWVRELIERLPAERIGLLSFAGTSFLECPLTLDRNSLLTKLGELDSSLLPVGGTNIQQALEKAQEEFQAVPGDHRVIILISDGDEVQGQYQDAVNKLKEEGIPVYVIGIGDPHKPGVVFDAEGSTQKDSADDLILSQANENTLQNIARETGGLYVPFDAYNPLNNGLNEVQKKIEASAASKLKEATVRKPKERYVDFLLPAIFLLILRLFIGERRSGTAAVNKAFITTMIFLACTVSVSAEEMTVSSLKKVIEDEKSSELLKDLSHYNLAGIYLKKAAEKQKDKSQEKAAVQPAKEGEKKEPTDFELALEHYQKASESKNESLRFNAFFSLAFLNQSQARQLMLKEADKSLEKLNEAVVQYSHAVKAQFSEKVIENQKQALLDRQRAKFFKEIQEAHKEALEQTQKVVVTQDKLSPDPKAEEARKKQAEQAKAQAKDSSHRADGAPSELSLAEKEALRPEQAKNYTDLSTKVTRLAEALKAPVKHPQKKQWLEVPDLVRNASQSFFTRNDAVSTQFAVQSYKALGGQWPIPPQDPNQQNKDQDKKDQKDQDKKDQDKKDQKDQDKKDQKDQDKKDQDKKDQDKKDQDKKDQDKKDQKDQDKKDQDKKDQDKKDQDKKDQDKKAKKDKKDQEKIDKSELSDKKRDLKDKAKKRKKLTEEEIKQKAAETLLRKMEQNNKSLRKLLLEQRRREAQNQQKLNPKDDR